MIDHKKTPEDKETNPNIERFKYEVTQELGLQNRKIRNRSRKQVKK